MSDAPAPTPQVQRQPDPAQRAAYEQALVDLRDAARALCVASLAAVEAARSYDPDGALPDDDPFVTGITTQPRSHLAGVARSGEGMAQILAVALLEAGGLQKLLHAIVQTRRGA